MTGLELYLLLKLDAIIAFFSGARTPSATIALVALAVFTISLGVNKGALLTKEKDVAAGAKAVNKFAGKIAAFSAISFLLARMICYFTPTTNEMAIIIVAPKIINNEKVQEIPERMLDIGMEWFDEFIPKPSEEK